MSPIRLLVSSLAAACCFAAPQPPLAPALSRAAEEAEVFQQNATKVLTQETLDQRATMPPTRFKPAAGQDVPEVRQPRLQVREIVSEYSVGALRDSSSGNLVEFRQVISVDGRSVQSPESARHALSLGVHSADDRLRKRMLEDFARHGLVDLATDYGIILLAFTRRGQQDMRFALAGEGRVGPDDAIAIAWQQTSSAAGELEFRGKLAVRRALTGLLWCRKSDGLPLRIEAFAEYTDKSKHRVRDQATVDYIQSAHGFLTPVSVLHQHVVDGRIITENHYRYEPFKLFGADTEIKFTEVPDPVSPPPPSKK
jgi:hypothetical protein